MVSSYTTDPIEVIDVDSHYSPPPGFWEAHAPAAFKDRVPRIGVDEQGMPQWVVDGQPFDSIGFNMVRPDGTKAPGNMRALPFFEQMHAGSYDAKARVAWLPVVREHRARGQARRLEAHDAERGLPPQLHRVVLVREGRARRTHRLPRTTPPRASTTCRSRGVDSARVTSPEVRNDPQGGLLGRRGTFLLAAGALAMLADDRMYP
jgi:hypothetical protein